MAVYLIALLTVGILLSFYLALKSIENQYLGSLACWTISFTPLAAGIDIVLNSIVKKNMQENTSETGDGIRYRQLIQNIQQEGSTI